MDDSSESLCIWVRAFGVHVVYFVYYICLWIGTGYILDEFPNEYNRKSTIAAGVIISLLFLASQALLLWLSLWEREEQLIQQTWCHLPMLVFIVFTLGPYGFALNYQYKAVNPRMKNITSLSGNCFDLVIPETHFFMLQIAMVILVVTYLAYPFPNRKYKRGELYAIGIEFLNAFDIMDIISDLGCVQSYEVGWFVIFFIALGVSAILLAFPVGLEEKDDDDPETLRRVSSIMTLIFTDIFFCIIRCKVIHEEKSLQSGFNFLIKNFLAAIIRFILIVKEIRSG